MGGKGKGKSRGRSALGEAVLETAGMPSKAAELAAQHTCRNVVMPWACPKGMHSYE